MLDSSRFELAGIAGTGGMATVYRALDRESGEPVAIKMLRNATEADAERFAREIRVLAALRHPGIVRHIADGRTPAGELWLAMEWLDGESLSQRLARQGLTAGESVELARRVGEAVGVAHERGIIHRDLKPSNLFLPGGALDRVKVLDFGVARLVDGARGATRTGVLVGTPGYMAPEQVRGEREIASRADVFALGCVLFECLCGRPAFAGEHVMAVLAKILLEDAPRVAELRPELPAAIDELLERALAKEPERRPRDGSQLAAELAALGSLPGLDAPARRTAERPAALTTTERRLVCVVMLVATTEPHDAGSPGAVREPHGLDEPRDAGADGAASDPREVDDPAGSGDRTIATPAIGGAIADVVELARAAAQHGGQLQRLADGAYVVAITGGGEATEQAVRAARCALALRAAAPGASVAVATGRGVMADRQPFGDAIDRAAELLRGGPRELRLDDVTAGLLDTRFDLGGDASGLFLVGERDVIAVSRTLLGKHTPCVGRDRELGVLFGLFEECVAEPLARAALVTGPAGIGKSRLRYELVRRIAERAGQHIEVWIGRGDPMRAGAPFGMIAPALRRTAGILDGEPVEVRRHKLRARVMRNASVEPTRTVQFLGELVGAPFPDDDSVELRAARRDPHLMGDQVQRAFEHFLAIETAAQPVLIVLEDLHWGDLPTTKLIDGTLRALPDRPWMVVALARPELHELFPRLWSERGVHELRVEPLTRRGSERLVRGVLGDTASDTLVARLVEQAAGNAFYLEELVRAVVDGKGDAMPGTVLAGVQGRLERLEVDARRVLRAASVFGQQFWRGGVTALLGGAARGDGARAWLDELVARELVARVPASRFAGDEEYIFRHSVVCEAAYAMLTEADKQLGHRLAGDWLERTGELDATVLAEHFKRGGDLARASEAYLRAAEDALAACDFAAAAARAESGVACGARGELLGALRVAQAEAHKWCGEFAAASRYGVEAMQLLRRGGMRWFAAAGEAAEAAGKLADVAGLVEIGQALRSASDEHTRGLAARVTATAHAAFQLFNHGNHELAQVLLDRVELATGDDDPHIAARIHQARSSRAMYAGDAGAYLESEQAAAAAFERAGDRRYACMQRGHVGYACLELGLYAEAERWLRETLEAGAQLGLSNVVATAKHNLGRALQHQSRLAEAHAVESEAVAVFAAQGDGRLEAAARLYLANILVAQGDAARAEHELELAVATASLAMRPQLLATLAGLRLALGRTADGLALAREAHAILDQLGGVEEGESHVRLMLAEALAAAGDHAAARAAAHRARDRLLARASAISRPEWRTSFLERIPEHARTLAFAAELG